MINARVFNVYNDILPDNCNHHRKPEAVDSDEEVNKMGHDDAAMGADVVWHRIDEEVAGKVEQQDGVETVVDNSIGKEYTVNGCHWPFAASSTKKAKKPTLQQRLILS